MRRRGKTVHIGDLMNDRGWPGSTRRTVHNWTDFHRYWNHSDV